jgi:non-ribosomal peptide synthetase-like protein
MPTQVAIDVPPEHGAPRQRFSYAAINRMADRLSRSLMPLVQQESVVAILLPKHAHYLYVAQLAVLKAGAAYTCIDPASPAERIRFIVQDSQAVAVLTCETYAALFDGLDVAQHGRVLDVPRWLQRPEEPAWRHGTMPQPRRVQPHDLAYVIYTSGTTGQPKGVMVEHRNIVHLVRSNLAYFDIGPQDRVGQSASQAFDASVEETYLAFATGATLVTMSEDVLRLGPDLPAFLRREHITAISPTPTLLRMCQCVDPTRELPDLRLIYVGGEALPADLAALWAPGHWLENAYGPTECTVTVVRGRIHASQPVTIGRPVAGNRALILDEYLHEVTPGQQGELCIRGHNVARGYLNRSDLTDQKFINHPRYGRLYRTGDLVQCLPSGELVCRGRLDTQVKIRGYRIELEAIESCLAQCDGIEMAACKVQGTDGEQQLVAFVVLRSGYTLDCVSLRETLNHQLPPPMVPTYFATLPMLPTTVSGKLDRQALPVVECRPQGDRDMVAPRNGLEARIAQALRTCFPGLEELSIHDNFFALGGTSITAAQSISTLRRHPDTAALTVRDLYEAPTVAGLAEKLGGQPMPAGALGDGRRLAPGWLRLCTTAQLSTLLVVLSLGSMALYGALCHVLPLLMDACGLIEATLLLPLLALVTAGLYIPLSLGVALGAKKLLIGTYKPGRYSAWGGFFFRNWLVHGCVSAMPWRLVEGTCFKNWFLRALGAKIGHHVHLHKGVQLPAGGYDLLEIGDHVTIARDAMLRVITYQDHTLILGPVTIGDNCTLETRSGMSPYSTMEPDSYLTALSLVPSHGTVPAGEMWEGIPAQYKGPVPEVPPCTEQPWSEVKHACATLLMRWAVGLTLALPMIALELAAIFLWDLDAATIVRWLFAPQVGWQVGVSLVSMAGSFALGLFMSGIVIRLLGPVRPGVYSRWRGQYIRIKIKQGLLEGVGKTLSGTLFWPWWLRLAGMRLGRNCEISTIEETIPELVEIGPETFFADGIYLGVPAIHRGTVRCEHTTFGQHTFLGNHVVVPAGSHLPDDILVGVCTVARDEQIRRGTAWFGHPAFELPHREVVKADPALTYHPSVWRYAYRLFWESLRFFFPVLPLGVMLGWCKLTPILAQASSWPVFFLGLLPLLGLATAGTFVGVVWALKWLLLGRVRPGQHPLWSSFVFKWDFIYMVWSAYAKPLMSVCHQTMLINLWLRAMGARIGKRVLLSGIFAQVVDPDMLRFEDDTTVTCDFQAHSFEDRVLKLGYVDLRTDCTAGAGAVLLYGAEVGAGSHVGEQSVVMKHEVLLPRHYYVGAPTRPALAPHVGSLPVEEFMGNTHAPLPPTVAR